MKTKKISKSHNLQMGSSQMCFEKGFFWSIDSMAFVHTTQHVYKVRNMCQNYTKCVQITLCVYKLHYMCTNYTTSVQITLHV